MIRLFVQSIILFILSQSICEGKFYFKLRKKNFVIYNILSIYLISLFFHVFLHDVNIVIILTSILIYILSLIMYYVHEFRGTNFNFSDILSINTAKEVALGYKYNIRPIFIMTAVFIFIETILLRYVNNVVNITFDFIYFGILNIYIEKLLCLLLLIALFFVIKEEVMNNKFDYSLFAGINEGYIYNFISSINIFYEKEFARDEIENEVIQFIQYAKNKANIEKKDIKKSQNHDIINSRRLLNVLERPHIIVVMNESFGSVYEKVKTNKQVCRNFNNLDGVLRGNLYVNTFGGGTANTEFEFLTGMTIGNYQYPVMPYNNFINRDKYSLARYFNNLSYKTIAMHPYTATNYHRDKVYKRFGFDELIFENDFKNKSLVRNFISDKSFYEEIIQKFEKEVIKNNKLFIFGITMQNHSGYKYFDGADIVSNIDGVTDTECVDAYLSLIKISDEALKLLIDYFSNVKEHVIILFFGDHNASFGNEINKVLYDDNINYACSNAYKTPFFIYDNKKMIDDYIDEVSANFLSLELLKVANLPYDMWHEVLNEVYKNYSVYNYHMMKDRDNKNVCNIKFDRYMKLERKYLQ